MLFTPDARSPTGTPVLGWHDLAYTVQGSGAASATKEVLSDLTGYARAGKVLGVMGPSGAGKSTFLNLLAGQLGGGKITSGAIRSALSGKEAPDMLMYLVPQEDTLPPTLTVREMLTYSARLQASGPDKTIASRVEAAIDAVGLRCVADSRIGGAVSGEVTGLDKRGISGGERKRLAIAGSLLSDRPLLLLDEPTSGLDATNAANILELCGSIAKKQLRAVVLTVHQPRTSVFEQLDDLLLLSKGRTVYFGPRGEDLTHYLQFYLRIPAGIVQTSTRANLLLDMVQSFETGRPIAEEELTTVPSSRSLKSSVEGAQRTEEAATQANPGSAESEDGVPSLSVVYSKGRSRSVKVPVLDSTSSFVSNKLSLSGMSKLDLVTAYNASSAHVSAAAIAKDLPHVWKPGCNGSGFNVASTKVLLGRALTADVWNDPSWILTLAAQTNFALVFLGTLFWHVPSSLAGVYTLASAIFLILTAGATFSWYRINNALNMARLFQAEHVNGVYAPLAQALARMAFDDLMTAVVHVPAFMYFYWLVGLRRSAGAFFIFIAINWLSLSTYATCSVALSYVIGVDWLVTLINTTTLAMWAVTSGVFTSTSGVPVWWRWLSYVNPIRYAGEALLYNQLEGMGPVSACDDAQKFPIIVGREFTRACPNGDQIAASLGLRHGLGYNVGLLVAIHVLMRVLFFVGITLKGYLTSSNRHTLAAIGSSDDKAGSSPGAAHDSDMENGAATDLQKLGAKPGKQVPGLTPRAALYRPSSKITSFLVGVVLSAAILGFSSGLFGSGLSQKRATYQWDLSTKEDYPDLFGYIDPTSFPADEVLQYDGYSRQTLKSIRSYWKSFYPPANPPIYFAGNDTLGPDKEIDSLQELLTLFPSGVDLRNLDASVIEGCLTDDTSEGALLLRIQLESGFDNSFSRLTSIPPANSFPVADSVGVRVFLNTTLQTKWGNAPTTFGTAIAQGRLYMSDHHVIDNLQHEQGYATYAAKVLYYLLDNGKLATVAVQLGQSPSSAPVLTAYDIGDPVTGDSWAWRYVRACARHAIGLNGATNHMANLHWVIETIRAAMDRTLPETHPIHRLVYPFTGYVSILNAVTRLPGVLPFRLALEGQARLVSNLHRQISFVDTWNYNATLTRAGFDKPAAGAPEFADVSDLLHLLMDLWRLQDEFASRFVDAFYPSDAGVAGDEHLQSFVAELSDPNGGNIRNLTRSGRVATKADLSGVLARILHRRILHGVTGCLWLDRMILHPICGVPVLRSNIPVVASMTESTFIRALGTRLDLVMATDFLNGAIVVPSAKPMIGWKGTDFFEGDPSLVTLMNSYLADTMATIGTHDANGTWAFVTQWGGVNSQ